VDAIRLHVTEPDQAREVCGRVYYLIAELGFASQEAFEAAMATPEGHAAGADVPNFATGGVTMFIAYD
jgi:uncharacterized protein (TIGR02118 family)